MENTNTRNIILAILGLIVVAGIGLYFSSNGGGELSDMENKNNEIVNVVPEFGDLTNFVKTNLTVEEKENLKIILEQRKDRQVQIKDLLDAAYEKGDMEKAWIEVAEIREKCKGRILPFISESKMGNFESYCDGLGEKLESNYVQK